MIVRRFLLWVRTASAGDRAEAVQALARAFLYSDLSPEDRSEAQTALTAMLDDPSPLVRRALAESLANAPAAPHPLIVALAQDQSDIAALILARSPVLTDADLIDAAALGDALIQIAIAGRWRISVPVTAALAEIAESEALIVLARNGGALLLDTTLARMLERHGENGALREALLQRPDLPVELRQDIAARLADSLSRFVSGCGWIREERISRITLEAREKTTIALSCDLPEPELEELLSSLRRSGHLTPALILRALLSRRSSFVKAAFADLTGLSLRRVSALLDDRRGHGLVALCRKAGFSPALEEAFAAAFAGLREERNRVIRDVRLSRPLIKRTLEACDTMPPKETGKLLALLRRFEAEAARDEARDIARSLADEEALSLVLRHAPHMLEEDSDEELRAYAA
jgi:uncharacterized protein (DUF2336 family)